MTFADDLIFSDSLHRKKARILKKIKDKKIKLGLYCIALPSNKKNLMDIYNYNELLQPAMRELDIHVIGLAASKEEAFDMIVAMLDETYEATNGFDIVGYFDLNQ